MLDDVRRYVEAAFEQVSPTRAREVARSMLQGQPSGQVNRVARELVGWSQRTRERITELVQAEVRRQLRTIGAVTRDDLDTLRARVRELERSRSGSRDSASGRSTARRSTSGGSGAKRSKASTATRKSTARKTTSRKTTAKKSSARSSNGKRSAPARKAAKKAATTSGTSQGASG